MRVVVPLFVSVILVGSITAPLAQDYSVSGVGLGQRLDFNSKFCNEYRCNPSEIWSRFYWCKKEEDDDERRGSFKAYYSMLHSTDGTIVYVNRFQEPAYWRKGEIQHDIDYYSTKIGGRPNEFVHMPSKKGYEGGAITIWGNVTLEPVVDSKILSIVASGKPANIGVLIDFVGNYEWSVKNDLPLFRLSGGPGFVWAASHKQNGRGTLRFSAINPSAFYPGTPPPPPPQPTPMAPVPVPPPQQQQTSSGTGFFVSGEGHIVTNAHVVEGCRYVSSSRGGRISRVAYDDDSDLALYISSEKPRDWASLRGGYGPRQGESVLAIGFPLKGILSKDPIVTTGIISALAGLRNDRRTIQITAPVQPGNSGGPLLGENGSIVGVVVAKLDALRFAEKFGDIPQNVNFAVSLGTLQSFLNAHGVSYLLNDKNVTKSFADIAAEASRYTVLLECTR